MSRRWLAVLIFAVALLLRLFGLGWGLPNSQRVESLHPDEPIVLMVSKQVNPLGGDFEPGFYNYGTLYLSLSRLISTGGEFAPGTDAYRDDLMRGRLINVVAGSGIALLVFLILAKRTSKVGAVIGGLAVAFAPGLVVHSRFMTVDVFATFLVVLALYLADRIGEENTKPMLMVSLAGLASGLAGGTKYNFIIVLLAVFVAIGVSGLANRLRLGLAAFGACIAGFLIGTPGVLLNPSQFRKDLMYEINHVAEGHGLVFAGRPIGFISHLGNLLEAFGGLSLIISVAACGFIAWRMRRDETLRWMLPGLVFAAVYYLLIGRAQVAFLRYVFPIIPVLALGLGWLVAECERVRSAQARLLIGFAMFSIGGFGGGGLAASVKFSAWMAGEDVRDQAGAWLKERTKGETVGLVSDPWFYSPTLYPEIQASRPLFMRGGEQWMLGAKDPAVTRGTTAWAERYDWDPSVIETKPKYIVFSSFEQYDLGRLEQQKVDGFQLQQDRYQAFAKQLEQGYKLVQTFGFGGTTTHDMMYVRPVLFVYERK
ncbi:MAG: phospholipid carrier-dependent glycosyltransferase [Chthonomonas sp.]|nr:phospholipid carrier-dependent glycosyltransferase [Chthonomonas sp.]